MYKWDEMSARERDALVAEKVMGWTVPRYKDGTLSDAMFDQTPRGMGWKHFTTDISVAWQVVEKMGHYRIYKEAHIKNDLTIAWFEDYPDGFAYAPTAPEAICLAALKACGVEIE